MDRRLLAERHFRSGGRILIESVSNGTEVAWATSDGGRGTAYFPLLTQGEMATVLAVFAEEEETLREAPQAVVQERLKRALDPVGTFHALVQSKAASEAHRAGIRIEPGTVEGDLTVSDTLELRGLVEGDAIVMSGGRLTLRGMVCGQLVLHQGSYVEVHGTVGRDVTNRGGELRVFGTISGSIHRFGGITEVSAGASIGR